MVDDKRTTADLLTELRARREGLTPGVAGLLDALIDAAAVELEAKGHHESYRRRLETLVEALDNW